MLKFSNKVAKRFFCTARNPNMKLTILTPYEPIVKDFTDFEMVITRTLESALII